ncbi:vitamin K epoxide reductase family domain-containing protein [Purpureocillium lilacinum]|uniref:Vitamin K epoxide reductase family domain-containing protein n=1 Tax=Purpureocillium lilacinum TaxID=33203 RepID=A0A179GEL6_PURLI|nr:vitamin K epoxide reductase family domain-containing protein [Purpureocillium lilacinum]OAQ75958.1 vitamin K epoxide reductase family domain-containing protein [Purpureocillium lilacinum]
MECATQCRHGVLHYHDPSLSDKHWYRSDKLPHARWSLGKFGGPINIVSIAYIIVVFIFSFFPQSVAITPDSMNWNVLIYGVTLSFAVAWYFIQGKKQYAGPIAYVRADQGSRSGLGPTLRPRRLYPTMPRVVTPVPPVSITDISLTARAPDANRWLPRSVCDRSSELPPQGQVSGQRAAPRFSGLPCRLLLPARADLGNGFLLKPSELRDGKLRQGLAELAVRPATSLSLAIHFRLAPKRSDAGIALGRLGGTTAFNVSVYCGMSLRDNDKNEDDRGRYTLQPRTLYGAVRQCAVDSRCVSDRILNHIYVTTVFMRL